MNSYHYKFIIILLLLTSCVSYKPSTQAPMNETMPVDEREEKTATVSSWVISGAMAAKNNKKSWTATLNWRQQGSNHYQIRLMGPLGGGTVLIEKEGGMITYKDGPKQASSRNADELLYKQTGIRLPVNNLYYWVRGLPAPGNVQSTRYDEYNHLTQLKQAGYTIDYIRYTSLKHIDLPSKIKLQGNGVVIKLIIKHWSL